MFLTSVTTTTTAMTTATTLGLMGSSMVLLMVIIGLGWAYKRSSSSSSSSPTATTTMPTTTTTPPLNLRDKMISRLKGGSGVGQDGMISLYKPTRRSTTTTTRTPHTPHLAHLLLLALLALLPLPQTSAYVPAIPVNDTSALNLTDDSSLNLKWGGGTGGVYSARVSYQLEADFPTPGSDKGALVHFTEERAGDNVTTLTPWIAMIECRNWTHASDYWDVFTLARDRGARAALLYTTTAQSCLINQEYLDDFEKPLNVFATRSRSSAALIEGQFNVTDEQYWHYNETLLNQSFAVVNESLSGTTVPSKTYVIATLVARNSEGQATAYPTPTSSPVAASGGTSRGRSVPMIILYCAAGIIAILFLSVIVTGAVRALRHPERYGPNAELGDRPPPASTAAGIGQAILDTFPVIKFNRARKQGARPRDKTAYPSYDARREDDVEADYAESSCAGSTLNHLKHRDPESPGMEEDGKAIEMVEKPSHQREPMESNSRPLSDATMIGSASHATVDPKSPPRPSAPAVVPPPPPPPHPSSPPSRPVMTGNSKDPEIAAAARAFAEQRRSWIQNHMSDKRFSAAKPAVETVATPPRSTMSASSGAVALPPAMATTREQPESRQAEDDDEADDEDEVCPICLLEFEEGDEVRVLPCQLAHSFHKECIDPWLLEVSSSCPLCRKDFAAVPNPTSSELSTGTTGTNNTTTSTTTTTTIPTPEHESRIGRFGRYLAFVRRERRRHQDHDEDDTGQVELLPTDRSRRSRRQRRQEERWEQSGPGPF